MKQSSNKYHQGIAFDVFVAAFMAIVLCVTIYPFWNLGVISFNDAQDSMRGGLTFWPRVFSAASYESIFKDNQDIPRAAVTSVQRTVIGTILNVAITSWLAFVLSQKRFLLRKFLSRYVFRGLDSRISLIQ